MLRRAYELVEEQRELLRRRLYVAKAERVEVRQLELEFAAKKAELERLAKQLDGLWPTTPPARTTPPGRKPSPQDDATSQRSL